MTMEAFPHSGQQLASVHPCKHASVMKKFIDRMEAAQAEQGGMSPTDAAKLGVVGAGGKKKWGIGGMMRRVTGGEKTVVDKKEGEEEAEGLQVDFYLVIVSSRPFRDSAKVSREMRGSWTDVFVAVFEVHREHRTDHRGELQNPALLQSGVEADTD